MFTLSLLHFLVSVYSPNLWTSWLCGSACQADADAGELHTQVDHHRKDKKADECRQTVKAGILLAMMFDANVRAKLPVDPEVCTGLFHVC